MSVKETLKKVEEVYDKYLKEKESWKVSKENYETIIDMLKEEINKLNDKIYEKDLLIDKINSENLENEKGLNIREKQILDKFELFKGKTYLTIKHLVEDVIEPLEEMSLENPSSIIVEEQLKEQLEKDEKKPTRIKPNEAIVTVRENSGPAKKLLVRDAKVELEEMIKEMSKPISRNIKV